MFAFRLCVIVPKEKQLADFVRNRALALRL
jgi:hypothetical protein